MSLSFDETDPPLSVALPAAADRTTPRKPALPYMKNVIPYFLATAFFCAALLLWEYVFYSRFVPPPSAIWAYLVKAVREGILFDGILVTMRRLAVGYFIGLAAGIPLGLLTARFKTAQLTIGVTALGLQTLPSVCWAPLA